MVKAWERPLVNGCRCKVVIALLGGRSGVLYEEVSVESIDGDVSHGRRTWTSSPTPRMETRVV